MDTLQRARASRRGGQSFITKLLSKAQAITDADGATPLSISEEDRGTIDHILSQLLAKKTQLEELDQTICETIAAEQELESEIEDTEMYHFNLIERIITLKKFLNPPATKNVQPPPIVQPTQQQEQEAEDNTQQQDAEDNNDNSQQQEETLDDAEHLEPDGNDPLDIVSDAVVPHTHVVHNVGQSVIRLPKLTLPTFSGDPLQFQMFWDSFEAAVHNNVNLTEYRSFII